MRNVVCKYVYSDCMKTTVFKAEGECFRENTEISFIGNINPIRFGGYYFDVEINCCHLGKGIYYDIDKNMYIMNDYYFDEVQCEKDYRAYLSQKNGGIEVCTSIQRPLATRVGTMGVWSEMVRWQKQCRNYCEVHLWRKRICSKECR